MVRLYVDNLILILTETAPPDLTDAAIGALDHRKHVQVRYEPSDFEPRAYVPMYSKFIGQMGRMRA